jgi:hypothetical protein
MRKKKLYAFIIAFALLLLIFGMGTNAFAHSLYTIKEDQADVDTIFNPQSTFTLPWSLISSGGVGGSAGGYTVNSTLGQPVVGLVEEGDYSLCPGFWTRLGEAIDEFINFLPLILR